ncbi:hypothetical protein RHGRI_003195 [Rhododendron griersonianum]|uniref:Uncharacterized protein n=1 Tax=Rhododendron griersonianum TaxID=479676 RepID=A0AAV6L4U5_9ERIC|nr:hypothetical protein RHGRI_003195 [Rhododendron griersonianum]
MKKYFKVSGNAIGSVTLAANPLSIPRALSGRRGICNIPKYEFGPKFGQYN